MAKVLKVLGETAPKFLGTVQRPQPAGGFRDYPCYRFPKREACLMAMSYSYELQAKVFDRMTALEQRPAPAALPDFTNPAVAARAWADQVEAKLVLEAKTQEQAQQLAVAAPKAAALDRIALETDGAACLRIASKLAQVPDRQGRLVSESLRYVDEEPDPALSHAPVSKPRAAVPRGLTGTQLPARNVASPVHPSRLRRRSALNGITGGANTSSITQRFGKLGRR